MINGRTVQPAVRTAFMQLYLNGQQITLNAVQH